MEELVLKNLERDMHNIARYKLTCKGSPDMVYCKHRRTWDKADDNWRTSIGNTRLYGAGHYEKV